MPKVSSRRQQRWFFAQARKKNSKITMKQARAHARKGKAYKRLPEKAKKKR